MVCGKLGAGGDSGSADAVESRSADARGAKSRRCVASHSKGLAGCKMHMSARAASRTGKTCVPKYDSTSDGVMLLPGAKETARRIEDVDSWILLEKGVVREDWIWRRRKVVPRRPSDAWLTRCPGPPARRNAPIDACAPHPVLISVAAPKHVEQLHLHNMLLLYFYHSKLDMQSTIYIYISSV